MEVEYNVTSSTSADEGHSDVLVSEDESVNENETTDVSHCGPKGLLRKSTVVLTADVAGEKCM